MAMGGVGEAMLIGAVTGAGASAVTGGDPLKGALLGAAGGGIGAGVAGAGTATGAATGTTGAATGTAGAATGTAAGGAGIAGAPISQASGVMAVPGAAPTMGTVTAPQVVAGAPGAGQVGTYTTAAGASYPTTTIPGIDGDISILAQNAPTGTTGGYEPASRGFRIPTPNSRDDIQTAKTFPNIAEFYAKNKIAVPAGLGAMASALGSASDMRDEEEKRRNASRYSGPLSRFSYNPDTYVPSIASGGLMDTEPARRFMGGGHLGSYSDGGRLLKGPGDGMSDSIPGQIGAKQPARLADGEFVVPADVVSGIGNGSTDAGARKLYAMMDKVRKARTGSKKQGKEIDARKYMPA